MIKEIKQDIQDCKLCELHLLEINQFKEEAGYGKLLPKVNAKTNIMIVGLNPSRNRFPNLKHPFGGGGNFKKDKNAKFLEIFKRFGVFNKCYITNIVKCSTTNNDVNKNTVKTCYNHLKKEIEFCKPSIIIAAGNQVYSFLEQFNINNLEKIYHPNYCFSYHGIALEKYIIQIKNVLMKYGLLGNKYE